VENMAWNGSYIDKNEGILKELKRISTPIKVKENKS
jgi:hypothetical protein